MVRKVYGGSTNCLIHPESALRWVQQSVSLGFWELCCLLIKHFMSYDYHIAINFSMNMGDISISSQTQAISKPNTCEE